MMTLLGYVALVLTDTDRPVHPGVVEQFAQLACPSPQGPIPYRLYRPRPATNRRMPLVIWFHGRGEAGDDNRRQLTWLELVFGADAAGCPVQAVIVAVQCPAAEASWTSATWTPCDPLCRVDLVVREVIEQNAIDLDRIYLAGISQGATACWRYASQYPARFAGMLSMATCPANRQLARRLPHLPIWAFQSRADGQLVIDQTRRMIALLGQSEGNARLTVVDSDDHDCWTEALQRQRAWHWLLDQRRGQRERTYTRTLPGRYLTRSQAGLLSLAVLGACAVKCYSRKLKKYGLRMIIRHT